MPKSQLLSYIYPQLIDTKRSEYNKEIRVYNFLGKPFVSVDNLTQSGGLVTKIWKQSTEYLCAHHFSKNPPENILILGLGAGGLIENLVSLWPHASITALEIDEVMIDIGKKYFALSNYPRLKIVNADAFSWIVQSQSRYDLIIIDMYLGKKLPDESNSKPFLLSIKKHLNHSGIALFNRLTLKNRQEKNQMFLAELGKHFSTVSRIKTTVNQVYQASA
jgi:spermidine synthase